MKNIDEHISEIKESITCVIDSVIQDMTEDVFVDIGAEDELDYSEDPERFEATVAEIKQKLRAKVMEHLNEPAE